MLFGGVLIRVLGRGLRLVIEVLSSYTRILELYCVPGGRGGRYGVWEISMYVSYK